MKKNTVNKKLMERNFGINIVAVDEDGKSLGLPIETPPYFIPEKHGKPKTPGKVASSRPLPEDSKIQLKMLFPEKEDLNLLKANGTVKWVKQTKTPGGKYFLIGVHFREATIKEKEKITKLWKTHRTTHS